MGNRPISILGGGNIGHTMAADLSLSGYDVNFYEHPRFEDAFKGTLEKGVVEIEDQETGRRELARIHKVTTNMKEAISDVNLILMAIPSFGQELFFNTMIPYLKDGQVVVLMTGNLGSLRLRKLLSEQTSGLNITICETNTMPYGARLSGPAKVTVLFVYSSGPTWLGSKAASGDSSKKFCVSALPAKETKGALDEFLKFYPFYYPTKNVLVTALNNVNPVVHPAASVLNAGRIEYANLYLKCDFRLHREGHTPSVQRVEMAIFDEVASLIRAIGGKEIPSRTRTKEYFERCQTHPTAIQPRTLKDRYITEDLPYGLVTMSQLGDKLGVATPVMDAIIEIASVLNEEDYRKIGRNLESIGLDKLNKEQIINFVEGG